MLTPDRIGERAWAFVKIPVVVLSAFTWLGFVITFIARRSALTAEEALDTAEVDLSAAAGPRETVIASAERKSKLIVAVLALICAGLAVWDGFLHLPRRWLRVGIWSAAALSSIVYLIKLTRCRVILSPSSISWIDHGQSFDRQYKDVRDFSVLSRSEIRIVFLDGQRLSITSDMADLRRVLATITARRLA